MAIFALIIDRCATSSKFLEETELRLKSANMMKNPFIAKIKRILIENNKELIIFSISVIYPNYSIFGWFIAIPIFFIWGFNLFFYLGIALGCLGIFWRKEFYIFMLKKGLKKAGYTARIDTLTIEEAFNKIYFF